MWSCSHARGCIIRWFPHLLRHARADDHLKWHDAHHMQHIMSTLWATLTYCKLAHFLMARAKFANIPLGVDVVAREHIIAIGRIAIITDGSLHVNISESRSSSTAAKVVWVHGCWMQVKLDFGPGVRLIHVLLVY